MVRTQVQLPEEQLRRLRRTARTQGLSISEVVRRCIERALAEEGLDARWERALTAAGAFQDPHGSADVATRHDAYLDEAYR